MGDLTEFFMNGSSRIVGKTIEFENTSWIAPAREGMLISNIEASIVSFVDFRGAHKLHELKNLSQPVMIGETESGSHWYAACAGGH